jgi:hypothetical protein
MFRTVEDYTHCFNISGLVHVPSGKGKRVPLVNAGVYLLDSQRKVITSTATDKFGSYTFACVNLPPDGFLVAAGGVTSTKMAPPKRDASRKLEINIDEAHPTIDLNVASVGDIAEMFEVPRSKIVRLQSAVRRAGSLDELREILGVRSTKGPGAQVYHFVALDPMRSRSPSLAKELDRWRRRATKRQGDNQ